MFVLKIGLVPHRRLVPLFAQARAGVALPRASARAQHTEPVPWTVQQAGRRKQGQRNDLQVVLVSPQIPQNAGSVARTCAASNIALHLVGPLGFEIDDRRLKRAGLDYWDYVVVDVHKDWDEFDAFRKAQSGSSRLIAFSKFGKRHHATPGTYETGDWLLFGAETTGLPPEAHEATAASGGHIVRIPMVETHVRSLNLAVSVGVGVFEALRQRDGANELPDS